MVEEQLISVVAEDDIVATLTTFDFYINVDENVVECSFQFLKVVIATFVGIDKKILTPQLSKVTKIRIKQIMGKKGTSWIRAREILARVIKSCANNYETCRYGLRYKLDAKSHNKMMKLRREKKDS